MGDFKIAITGHRPHKLGYDYYLTSPLIKAIEVKLQDVIDRYQPSIMISGMALGIDTLWAQLAIKNKIKLIAAIPCKAQDTKWKLSSRELYHRILSDDLTQTVMVLDDYYNDTCMHNRNIWMVDNCDLLIAVWDGSPGGTGNCVKYAKKQKVNIYQIKPTEI